MIIDTRRKFIFIHIPKTAGTSLRKALTHNGNIFRKIRNRISPPKKIFDPKTKHLTYMEFLDLFSHDFPKKNFLIEDYKIIAFVRNPKTRFESLHRYLLEYHREKYPLVPENINNFVDQFSDGSFEYIGKIRSLKTQYSFIEGVPEERLFVGRFENIEDDWNKLCRIFKLESKLGNHNRTLSPVSRPKYEISDQSISKIREIFSVDFEKFYYEL